MRQKHTQRTQQTQRSSQPERTIPTHEARNYVNFTRWSARFPGTQRRAAAREDRGSVPAARAEYAQPEGAATAAGPAAPQAPAAPEANPAPPGTATDGAALDDLPAREILGRLPAPVALFQGSDHRVVYVNAAYEAAFGTRPCGAPATEVMPELAELSVLPLMDQVLRSGTPRTVKSRRTLGGASYTVTCTPVAPWDTADGPVPDGGTAGGEGGVLVHAADVTDHAEAAERLRTSERRHREMAVTLQRSLLPQELEQPDDLRIAATYQPGGTDAAVGGDWYDVITLGAGRTALVIGDVMGRGVRAAAVMGQLRTAVRAYARLDLPPHEVLQLLDGLAAEIDATQIATCVYAVHDPNEGHLVFASAGHLPILVCDEDGTVRVAEDPTGPPLGTGGWIHTSGTIELPPGSTAVLYTDGLVERRSEDIDEGVAALGRALSGAKGSPQVVCDRLIRSLGVTAEHDDDVAVLVIQHPARKGADAELFHNASLELLGGVEAAPRARAFATGVLTSWRFPAELRDLGVLAASELVANSLQHGTPPMRLGLRRTDRRLIIEVTDGDDHLPRRRRAEPGDESGRGIAIVATVASSWGSRRTPGGGKAVWCEFALPR